jgi:hypothetical protein
VVGDFIIGGSATVMTGISAAVSNQNTKTELAIAGAVAGGITTIGAAVAGFTASNFVDLKCTDVVSPLPASRHELQKN